MLMDIVTGFLCGVKNEDVSSKKMREGLFHKAGFLGMIVLSVIVTQGAESVEVMNQMLGDVCVDSVCGYIILTEVVSVIENLCILNPTLADSKFGQIFKQTTKVEDQIGDNNASA